ncbi:MAG TPA: DUF3108 domain-containing protein [Polyangia bacterium]
MSTALLLIALGTVPALPDELGFVDPCNPFDPRDEYAEVIDAASEAPAEAPALPALPPALAAVAPAPPATVTVVRRPAGAVGETMRYQVAYGVLGGLGEVKISYSFPPGGPAVGIRASGSGTGSLFGLGRVEKLFENDMRPGQPAAHRWTATRVQGGKIITDTVEQTTPGEIAVLRRRNDRPDEGHKFTRGAPVLDPLAFLWRLRQQPPTAAETFEVLDGRALWQIAMVPTRTVSDGRTRRVLVVSGHASPIFWDGKPDDERTARTFTLWIEDDPQRTPLRLVMPLAIGRVQVDLRSVTHRPAPTTETVKRDDRKHATLVKRSSR